jgi:hypothetical protein
MKTGSIASNLVALSLGALLTACGGAEMNDGSQLSNDDNVGSDEMMSSFDEVEEEVTICDDTQYDHWKYLSGLAVAAAIELGRWDAGKDFYKETSNNSPRVLLSQTGLARCNPTGCPNVSAILQMQNTETAMVGRHDPLLLRQYMVTYFDRQKGSPAPVHSLSYVRSEDDICGLRYYFTVGGGTSTTTYTGWNGSSDIKATSSYRCLNAVGNSAADGAQFSQVTCNGAVDQKFTLDYVSSNNYRIKDTATGKCLGVTNNATGDGSLLEQRTCGANNSQNFALNSKGNGTFEIKNIQSGKCVDMRGGGLTEGALSQIYSCHNGANQTFQMTGFVNNTVTVTATSPAPAPSTLWSQLKFAGENENKYLMFKSDANLMQVSIDPMGTMVDGGGSATSGACASGSTAYASAQYQIGGCCSMNSKYGTLAQSTFNPKMLVCKL